MATDGTKDANAPDSQSNVALRPAADAESAKAQSNSPAQPPPKAEKSKSKKQEEPLGASLPDFMIERNKLFDELYKLQVEEIKNKPREDITVTLDIGDGQPPKTVAAKSWETTPGSFLRDAPKEISANVVVAKLDGKELWDLNRPLERDCSVRLIPFDSTEGREVFWHSSAHALGEACECHYGCLLSHGPPTAQGFFYDMALEEGYVLSLLLSGYVVCLCCDV